MFSRIEVVGPKAAPHRRQLNGQPAYLINEAILTHAGGFANSRCRLAVTFGTGSLNGGAELAVDLKNEIEKHA
jgi:hypothetical protein